MSDYLPPVVARLSMDLGDFAAKIEEAKAMVKELGGEFKIKADFDNSTFKQMAQDMEAIHRMMGKDQAIRERVDLDDGAAKAKLAFLTRDREVKIRADVSDGGGSRGFLSRLLTSGLLPGGRQPGAGAVTGLLSSVPPALAGPGLLAVGGGLAALLTEITGVVSGFAAAGAGAVAFAALAKPAISNVHQAYTQLKAAQAAYNKAQYIEQVDPTKAHATALKNAGDALKYYQNQVKQLGPAGQSAITGIQALIDKGGALQKAFQPTAVKVFSDGLKLLNNLMPAVLPFATTFGNTLDGVFKKLDKFTQSQGFKKFLDQFHSIEGPALNSIFNGIGNVANSIGKLLTTMSGKDVAHSLNIAFGGISGIINGITGTIKGMMNTWDGAVIAFRTSSHSIASVFDNVRHGIAASVDGVIHDFAAIPGKIKAIYASAASWLVSAGKDVISGFVKGAKDTWNTASSWFSSINAKVTAFFAGAGSWLLHAGEAIMSGLLSGLESAWGKVAGFLSSLAGKIKSLKGPLDYDAVMLYPAGQAIMGGLMGGMRSQMPAFESQLRGIGSTIRGASSGWVQSAGTSMVAAHGGSGAAGSAGSIHSSSAGGGSGDIHVTLHLDGRQIYSGVQRQAVSTQRRTGSTGLGKRTR